MHCMTARSPELEGLLARIRGQRQLIGHDCTYLAMALYLSAFGLRRESALRLQPIKQNGSLAQQAPTPSCDDTK